MLGEPPGQVRAQPAGAAGDEGGALGPPRFFGRTGRGGVPQPADQSAGGADRALVFGPAGDQQGGQPGGGAVVDGAGQVDQAAPPLGMLQGGHPAQPPDLRLYGVGQRVGGGGGDRALGQAPQGSVDAGVAEGLDRGGGGGQTGGDRGEGGEGVGIQGEQADDTGRRGVGGLVRDPPGQDLAVGLGGVEGRTRVSAPWSCRAWTVISATGSSAYSAGTSSNQVPLRAAVAEPDTGFQVTWYRHESSSACSRFCRRQADRTGSAGRRRSMASLSPSSRKVAVRASTSSSSMAFHSRDSAAPGPSPSMSGLLGGASQNR